MPGRIIEVEQQVLEILDRITPYKGINEGPDEEGNQDPGRSPAEELTGRIMQGKLQIAGGHDEKGNRRPGNHIQDRHPDGIGLRKDERSLPAQVKRLAAVRQDDQETGNDPHPVHPYLPPGIHYN